MTAGVPPREALAGRYRLDELIGAGGVARVYRAFDQRLDRYVAVKLFQPALDAVARRRFVHEARVLGALNHPGLVRLFDVGVDEGRAYLVMELIDGPTLLDMVSQEPLPSIAVARLGAKLADALAYVHASGVVHRDIKPSNILIDADQEPRLADFGFASALDATRVSPTGQIVGTAAYLAPEQVRGEHVDTEADIYALGLVLLECLTGELEYEGPRVEAALARLSRPPRIPTVLPAPLAATLVAMTRSVPRERPTAAVCAARLTDVAARLATRHGVASLRQLRRRRAAAAVALAALAVAGVLLARSHWQEPAYVQQHAEQPVTSTEAPQPELPYVPLPMTTLRGTGAAGGR
ncbi:MAG: serine/threonine protein kinase [Kutzneria sp.]|nr:serine/threonine protein kinase [Kutzneria sp.]MBV9847715.1 serine/threonine protein kinase [Kutzneria sp.]